MKNSKDHTGYKINKESEDVKMEKKYKYVLEGVLANLRSIDGPNEADDYINDSIRIITNVLANKEEK